MYGKHVGVLTLAAMVVTSGCESSTEVGTELADIQVQALAEVLLLTTFQSAQSGPAAVGAQLVPVNFEQQVEADVPCPLGGMLGVVAAVSITGDTESEGGEISYSQTQSHVGCVVESEDGTRFTLDGSPSVTAGFTISNDGLGNLDVDGSMDGGIGWAMDGLSGTCQIDLAFVGDGSEADGTWSASLTGSVCGVSITRTASVG
jgi:hypothetical protein